jgi:hypothetical protein
MPKTGLLLLKFLLILTVLVLLSLAYNAVFWSDDYANIFRLKANHNILRYLWAGYMEWDGRHLSVQALFQIVFIRYLSASMGVFLWSCCLLWLSIMLVKIIRLETQLSDEANTFGEVWTSLLLFVVLWFGFSFHIADTMYWVTGGVYMMSLAMVFSWVYLYLKWVNEPGTFEFWVGFLLGLLVGLSGVNAGFPLLVLVLLDVLIHRRFSWQKLKFPLLMSVAIFVSTMVTVVAPGNFIRATYHENSFTTDILFLFVKAVEFLARYMYYSLPAIAGALLLGFLLPLSIGFRQGLLIKGVYPSYWLSLLIPGSVHAFLCRYRWFIITVSCIIPFLSVPDFSSRRAAVFFMAFLFLGVTEFIIHMNQLPVRDDRLWFLFRLSAGRIQLIVMAFLMITIVTASSHFYTGSQIRRQIEHREARFDALRGIVDTVYVEPVRVKTIPFSSKFHDLLCNSYADYHGFDAILMDTIALKDMPLYYIKAPR